MLTQIFVWLDRNKTYLSAIALPTITFAMAMGMDVSLGTYLATIIAVLTGGGKLIIDSNIKQETSLGVAVINARVAKANEDLNK